MTDPVTVQLAGMAIHALTERQVIEQVVGGGGGWVVTPNIDILRQVEGSTELADLVGGATLSVADGMPLIWASRLKGDPLPERIAGSTLIHGVCAEAARCGQTVYLLGGAPGVAERAAVRLQVGNPGLRIAGWHCPPVGFEDRLVDVEAMDAALSGANPDIVVVALPFPRQERLIARLRSVLPAAWFIGSGAALNFVAGQTPRAPVWLQRAGLEWVHRLCHEPGHLFKRYLVLDLPFAVRMLTRHLANRVIGGLRDPRRPR